MKQTVFRKVMVKDRLPVSFGQYITDQSLLYYHNGDEYFVDRHGYLCYPEWFLEEIELPSEDDLETIASQEFGFRNYDPDNGVFCEGANYILNKLK